MRIIDHIAKIYPDLDLASIRILLEIQNNPGFCIREIADILVMKEKFVRQKIAVMTNGRGPKTKHCRPLQLITLKFQLMDSRKRELTLTEAGESLARDLLPLTKRREK